MVRVGIFKFYFKANYSCMKLRSPMIMRYKPIAILVSFGKRRMARPAKIESAPVRYKVIVGIYSSFFLYSIVT